MKTTINVSDKIVSNILAMKEKLNMSLDELLNLAIKTYYKSENITSVENNKKYNWIKNRDIKLKTGLLSSEDIKLDNDVREMIYKLMCYREYPLSTIISLSITMLFMIYEEHVKTA